jgi:signal transduction histidine kinase
VTFAVSEPVVGTWDRPRMERVVSNLIANAMKFGSGKPIEITICKQGGRARLSVRDHGIGIARTEQARIFEMFERLVPARHYGGFGLGLWIAKRILDAHGGRILLWSRPGEGSEFTVDVPLRPAEESLKSAADGLLPVESSPPAEHP